MELVLALAAYVVVLILAAVWDGLTRRDRDMRRSARDHPAGKRRA